MRILLASTYELGRQPVHLASPAAALRRAGHDVAVVDLSVEELSPAMLDDCDAVAVSVPMHTAKRLADRLTGQIRSTSPNMPVAHYGLYAGAGEDRGTPVVVLEGEYEPGLVAWADSLAEADVPPNPEVRHIGRSDFTVPDRTGLPSLASYARLEHDGTTVLAGAVEASHGCRHRCRHCPIPAVYDGRMRVVPRDVVLADIDQLVGSGAGHITFGDPDFLNAPQHSIKLLERAHASHPELTFDVTVKVEHILAHEDVWPHLAEQGLLFVVSAFESVDEPTLEILDKGHTLPDMVRSLEILRRSGIHIRPTWLPFLPWTEADHVSSLMRFLDENDLHAATDPVQLAIKLLIPRGSLLEDHPAVTPHLRGYDPGALTWSWDFSDPLTEVLHKELQAIAAEASECGEEMVSTIATMRATVESLTGVSLGTSRPPGQAVPRLTESWFCCAEPTESQSIQIGLGPA